MVKTMLIPFVILLILTSTLLGQNRTDGPLLKRSIDERIAELSKVLLLTEDQQNGLRKILETHDKELKNALEQNRGNRRAMRAAMLDLQEKKNNQILNLLTKKQKEKYKTYLKEQQKKRSEKKDRPFKKGRRRF